MPICLRLGWKPDRLPEKCACKSSFTVEYALTCNCGGFRFLRHNEIRDLLAKLLTEVCPNMGIEPGLQPLSGETLAMHTANRRDEARLDIRAQGSWGERRHDVLFAVRVFNSHASSNRHTFPTAYYKKHEKEKRREYNQRVQEIEHGTFTPLVFSATGGMAPAAQVFYRRLAALISEKQQQSYGRTMGLIRCCLNVSLL